MPIVTKTERIAIIGGGAAGFFAAINCKLNYPNKEVDLIEKSNKTLSKVKVSGGGRCNVTHYCPNVKTLIDSYPRGGKKLKNIFSQFDTNQVVQWFEERGVLLKTEKDNRMFPITDKSHTIINCFHDEIEKLGVNIRLNHCVMEIKKLEEQFHLLYRVKTGAKNTIPHDQNTLIYDKIIIATGGSPKTEGFNWLRSLGHEIKEPVPSLFTFNMPGENTAKLMGVVAQDVSIKVQGTKIQQRGPLLFTHWGMSGPAVLKTSAWGARILSEMNYNFHISVNWSGLKNEELIREALQKNKILHHKKKIINGNPFDQITNRLWQYLVNKSDITETTIWSDCPKKSFNKLTNTLFNDVYHVNGKTTFKEEFVTCGGVDLSSVNTHTMQSLVCPGLYFAGEVLNVDGVTGGFNFQAAWSTGFVAAKLC